MPRAERAVDLLCGVCRLAIAVYRTCCRLTGNPSPWPSPTWAARSAVADTSASRASERSPPSATARQLVNTYRGGSVSPSIRVSGSLDRQHGRSRSNTGARRVKPSRCSHCPINCRRHGEQTPTNGHNLHHPKPFKVTTCRYPASSAVRGSPYAASPESAVLNEA